MNNPLLNDCAACNAEPGEECRPMCTALDTDTTEEEGVESLPEFINISRTISYDVPTLIENMKKAGEENLDLDSIMEYIQDDVREEMRAPLSRHDLTWTWGNYEH